MKVAKIVRSIIKFFFRPHTANDIVYQKNLLLGFIRKNKNTVRGKAHNFVAITNFQDFQNNVPLVSYDTLQNHIEHMLQGGKDILRKGDVPYFSKSSGTTAVSKYIPISKTSLKKNHYAAGKDVFGYYLHARPNSMLFSGEGLIMGGRLVPNPFDPSSNNVGDVSAILQYNAPWYTKLFRKPTQAVSFMEQFDKKLDAMIEETKDRNITFLAGVPSWLTLFLQRLIEKTGKKNVLEVWPNLELFMRGGINIAPYKKQLAELIPGNQTRYRQNYNASEGFFAIQDKPDVDDMLLTTHHHVFYEFINQEDIELESPNTLLIDQLEVGKKYEIVITTDGGLRRYRLGDMIKVTALDPIRVSVVGRTKSYINAFGEELMLHTTDAAIHYISEKYSLHIADYVATAVVEDKGGYHERFIDFGIKPTDVAISTIAEDLDLFVQDHNSDYKAKRTGNLLMKQLVIRAVSVGAFRRYLEGKGKMGGQYKIKRLWNNKQELIKEMGDILE